jgi:hypothetical protein
MCGSIGLSTYCHEILVAAARKCLGSGETGCELRYEDELLDLEPCGCNDLSESCDVVVIRVADLLDEAVNAKTLEHAGNLSAGFPWEALA